jgi:N-acetyl-gamma-glutamyl-phosphate reductase
MVVVLAVIDNLVKGAAGQAVQNLNLMFGFAETSGLEGIALLP